MRFAELMDAVFVIFLLSSWVALVLPLFFEPPHPVVLPGTKGQFAKFPTSEYALAEVSGTVTFLGTALVFIGIGVYVYRRMLADIPRLAALTEENRG